MMTSHAQHIAVVTHGGAGCSQEATDGCQFAAEAGFAVLTKKAEAVDAASAAVVIMEDDGRYNAGSGSILGLDGVTIEMDAGVMDSKGKLGAVACLQRVKNPVLVARAIADTPHYLLVGEGAERFARLLGFDAFYNVAERSRSSHKKLLSQLANEEGTTLPGVLNAAFAKFWNYSTPRTQDTNQSCDTVGAVVRDIEGHFAVAVSTGGAAPALLGRVGDSPIIGSGFYAGPDGAVCATGLGEHIVRQLLSFTVYRWLAEGRQMKEALAQAVELFPKEVSVGLIAVSRTEAGSLSNREMPVGIIDGI